KKGGRAFAKHLADCAKNHNAGAQLLLARDLRAWCGFVGANFSRSIRLAQLRRKRIRRGEKLRFNGLAIRKHDGDFEPRSDATPLLKGSADQSSSGVPPEATMSSCLIRSTLKRSTLFRIVFSSSS